MKDETLQSQSWFPGGERVASLLVLFTVLYLAYRTLRPVLLVVVLAAALVSLTSRMFEWLVQRLRGRRRLASALMVFTLVVAVIGSLVFLGAVVLTRLISEASALAQDQGAASVKTIAQRLGPVGPWVERAVSQIRPQLAERIPTLIQHGAQLFQQIGQAASYLAIGLFLLAVTLYYFYLNGPRWRDEIIRLLPLPASDVRTFIARFHQVSLAVLVGNVGTALVQGIVGTIGYVIVGAPAPFVFGVVTVLAALLPMVGTALVWIPLAAWMAISQSWIRALILVAYGLLVIGTVDNIVRPLLTRRGLRENPLLIFLAVFGGLGTFGIAGLFLGPLIMALTITVLDLYASKRPAA
jgi:predicted PurR-regulated permease PerM